jgi:hypothetical protein
LPSALLAYELFLPLCAAAFGLGSGVGLGEIWPQGMSVFLVHLAWATFFGIITLFFLRFYPTSFGGILFTGIVFVISIATVLATTPFGNQILGGTGRVSPTPQPVARIEATATPSPLASITPSPRADEATAVIGVPTGTASQTPKPTAVTLPATETPTATVTAEPTPIVAVIHASEGGGAFIRETPGGLVLATLGNGSTVTIIPNDLQEVKGVIWVHVSALVHDKRVDGWMIQGVLQTATPVADWQPSATP